MHSTQHTTKNRFEEIIRRNFQLLSLNQEVILAPNHAMELRSDEILLEQCTITKLTPESSEIIVRTRSGQEWTVDVDTCTPDRLCLGSVSCAHEIEYRYWAFLSEEVFWLWREWYILTTRLNAYISFTDCDVSDLPTERNLQIARILYDIFVNDNLGPLRTVSYEPLYRLDE